MLQGWVRDQYGQSKIKIYVLINCGGKSLIDTENIFVDTGVLRTLLPLEYHPKLKSVMYNMIMTQHVESVETKPEFSNILCYNISS